MDTGRKWKSAVLELVPSKEEAAFSKEIQDWLNTWDGDLDKPVPMLTSQGKMALVVAARIMPCHGVYSKMNIPELGIQKGQNITSFETVPRGRTKGFVALAAPNPDHNELLHQ